MKVFKTHWIVFILPLIFFIFKLSSISIRLSDTNVYFYTAYKLLEGQLLYTDIFFTNLPLFPFISSAYLLISGKSVEFYYLTAIIEVLATSFVIYFIVYKQWGRKLYAVCSQAVYLFSFIILATSDHQSGVFAASLFATLSYFFFQRKNYLLTGIFTAFAILTKAYFLPILLTYGVYLIIKKRDKLINFIAGGVVTAAFVLAPFFIFSQEGIINNVFYYSLTRGAGTNKVEVFQFFMFRDFLFFFLLTINLFLFRKHLFFSLFSFFTLLFILLYQDIYYLYLNLAVPFLVISLPIYLNFFEKKLNMQKFVLPSILVIFIFINTGQYISNYRSLQTVDNHERLVQIINDLNPEYIYGSNNITPILAYLSNTPLLNNTVDTNANIFRKGILNAQRMTSLALQNKTIVVVHGISYPQYNIEDQVLDEIVDKEKILNDCNLAYSHPVYAEGIANRINIFSCFE